MKNIVFKFLPLVAAVLFATSCSKDDGNDNSVVTDINTTTEPTTEPSTAAPEPTNTVQVEVDENGVPYIPFSITVGKENESLSKVWMQTDPDAANYFKLTFSDYDRIRITGTNITGDLVLTTGKDEVTATFEGKLSGTGVTTLTATTPLTATLYSDNNVGIFKNPGTPLTEPKLYTGEYAFSHAVQESSYLTKSFTFGSSGTIKLEEKTAFVKVKLNFFPARVYVDYGGETYTFDVPGNRMSSNVHNPTIAVPDGAKVRASFLKNEKTIDVSDGIILYNVSRSLPNNCIPVTFSISDNEQVFFSESNLLYRLSETGGFDMVDYGQYTVGSYKDGTAIGENYSKVSSGYADLFGWGTWVDNHAGSTTPKSTSTTYSDYLWTTTDNDGTVEPHARAAEFWDDWFTLSADEWDYLLNKRKMANPECLRYVRASIKDGEKIIPGLILFPDATMWATNDIVANAFKSSCGIESYTESFSNCINKDDWTWFCMFFNDVNDAGSNLVFLPAAGYRNGTTITYNATGDDVVGLYWASEQNGGNGYALVFDKDEVKVTNTTFHSISLLKSLGCSVRLVHALPTTKN